MVKIELDTAAIASISKAATEAAAITMAVVKNDLTDSQTMPMALGTLQGSLHTEQFEDGGSVHTVLQTDGPQARRLHYHPEYNFRRDRNMNAGGAWYAPYAKGGAKEKFVADTFAGRLKEALQ